jgi:subtilisin family serine protease
LTPLRGVDSDSDREHRAIAADFCMRAQQRPIAALAAADSPADPWPNGPEGSGATLDLVRLRPLLDETAGSPDVRIGLIDGPVDRHHPGFAGANVRDVSPRVASDCSPPTSDACRHGTLVAGVLVAARGCGAPALCPGCTLLMRPIFLDTRAEDGPAPPTASVDEVATAIVETVDAGATLLNLSVALAEPSSRAERRMNEALDHAARRGAIVVAAAGNQATVGSSAITRHPWVIAVIACDAKGRPTRDSNLSHSAGKRGLAAPGEAITSLAPGGRMATFSGTSAAAPFVTGAIALLWSLFPGTAANRLRFAITGGGAVRRTTVIPPLLDGLRAYRAMA